MASGNTKNFELKLGRAGLIIVIAGMAALLCSAFIFGVSVGKNIDTYPEKIASFPQRILALVWRPAKIRASETAVVDEKTLPPASNASEEIDLTYYKTLTGQKGVAKEQQVIPDKKKISATPPTAVQPAKDETKNLVTSSSADISKKNEEVGIEEPKDETKTSGAEPKVEASSVKYSVQVASLKEKIKATQMSKKISALGFKPQIVETAVSGKGKWHRIIVYGFTSKAQAQAAAEKINKKTKTNCVVKRIGTSAAINKQ